MSLQSVLDAIKFYGTNGTWTTTGGASLKQYAPAPPGEPKGDEEKIVDAIKYLWEVSDTARAFLENWVSEGREFKFGQSNEPLKPAFAQYISGYIGIDIDVTEDIKFINTSGDVQTMILPVVIMHELVHKAVTEATNAEEAARIAGFKKADMAEAAERLVEGKGWLPSVLRTTPPVDPEAEQRQGEGTAPVPQDDDAYRFAAE